MGRDIDLHVHTTYSDGTESPEEVLQLAKGINLKAIAITDHNSTDGVKEIYNQDFYDIEIISGIELTSQYKDLEIHILGLYIDPYNKSLAKRLKVMKEATEKTIPKLLRDLKIIGFEILMSDILDTTKQLEKGQYLNRLNIAHAMLNKGYVKNLSESFIKYLIHEHIPYNDEEILPVEESIQLIRQCGGLSFIAHPLLSLGYNKTKSFQKAILYMVNCGLNGMEVYHSIHSNKDSEYLLNIAKNNKMLISGGSDYHGNNKFKISLGSGYNNNLNLDISLLDNIKGHLAK